MVTPMTLKERERGKSFIFKRKWEKKNAGKAEQPYRSFSLLKCRGEKEMSPETSPAAGPCCLAAQEGFGVRLGDPGAVVPTLPVPPAWAAAGFHLAWLKLLFLASLVIRWLQRRQTIHAGFC